MPLKSAFEDLLATTLAGVAGLVGKIEYIAGLREPTKKEYVHWGLTRVHGEEGAQQALGEAHRRLFLKILQTPLRELREDVAVSSVAAGRPAGEYVESLRARLEELLPEDLGGGSAGHFSSVLRALLALVSRPGQPPPRATPRA